MIVILIASLLAAAPVPLPPIGAAWLAHDRACALIDAPALSPGREVTIVVPHTPQEVVGATIVGPARSCNPGESQPSEVPSGEGDEGPLRGLAYELRLSSEAPDVPILGIAFVGRVPAKRLSNAYELRVSDIYPRVRVRSCTSLEGVHLSVWSGTPRASRRLWRAYWHLGYDVEPTCERDEVDDSAPVR